MGAWGASGFFRRRPAASAFLLLFAGSFLIRLWPLLAIRQSWEDAYFYIALAESLARGHYSLLGVFHDKYLPGYPAAILLLHTAGAGMMSWFRSAQLVSTLAAAAVSGLCFVAVMDLTGNRRAALAAGLMTMLNAELVTWAGVPFSEALFSFLVVLALVLIPRAPLAAGVIAGCAAITRHEGWFLAAALAAALVVRPEKKRLGAGLAAAVAIGGAWWLLYHHELGAWPYAIYTQESAARGARLGHPGLWFLTLSLPVAGHLTTLFVMPGLPALVKKRAAWPLAVFLLLYLALHSWWMFGVERYFVPVVPLVCVIAGCGLDTIERLWRRGERGDSAPAAATTRRRAILASLALPALGLIAGATHFAGFAPDLVMDEATRTAGYRRAIEYLAAKPENFSVLAYDAFMVGYHDPHHPVLPSGMLQGSDWARELPQLYERDGLRYIIWSSLYPADREKFELSEPERVDFPGTTPAGGKGGVVAVPEKVFYWMYHYPEPSRLRPWRREIAQEARAIVFRLDPAP